MSEHSPHALDDLPLDLEAVRIGIAVARFNEQVVSELEQGCLTELNDRGVGDSQIRIVRVPGAYELPFACMQMARTGQFSALIALGAVIRGGTPHFEYVCAAANDGILKVGLDTGVPAIFGVLTTDTLDQALERSGLSRLNKGAESARAALEMIAVRCSIAGMSS